MVNHSNCRRWILVDRCVSVMGDTSAETIVTLRRSKGHFSLAAEQLLRCWLISHIQVRDCSASFYGFNLARVDRAS
jgi:hypothetical protein